jgi:hypothetical protein
MDLIRFDSLFPSLAEVETRTLTIFGQPGLESGDYTCAEAYCPDPHCDCQRVMINVFSGDRRVQYATISYGFVRTAPEAGPYLDAMNPQSAYCVALLNYLANYLEETPEYVALLKSHYAMVKGVGRNPHHPSHAVLTQWRAEREAMLREPARKRHRHK